MVTLSVPESLLRATNSLPELLSCLFDLHRARAELDLLDKAITEELAAHVTSDGDTDGDGGATSKRPACGLGQKSST